MRASTLPFLKAFIALLALFFTGPLAAQASRPDNMDRGPAMLLAEKPVAPGQAVDLAIRFLPHDGWHGYWLNPGDAGQGMTLQWTLPPGWKAGEPQYPVPHQLLIQGLMNHVFEGEHALIVPLAVPANAPVGQAFPVTLFAQWLSCSDSLCVPQWATLTATVTVGTGGTADPRFDGWRAALPPLLDRKAAFDLSAAKLRIAIPLPAALKLVEPHVFIGETQLVDYAAAQAFTRDGDLLVAEIPRKGLATGVKAVSGILKLDNDGNGVRFKAAPDAVPAGGTPIAGPAGALAPLWLLIGGALLGGLVLNLMPCVFPILSLKALTLARAGESEAEARREGMAYTAGVVLACVLLGAVLLGLRAGGSEVGWAFQLQEPGVVVALLLLAVAITANFAGLFELPSFAITRSGGRASA
ncbi:MAG: Thiol:disulfide interchange protein DsbD precursor, partial [Pseudomonadota bacterium]